LLKQTLSVHVLIQYFFRAFSGNNRMRLARCESWFVSLLRLFGLRRTTILQKKIVQMVGELVVLGVSF